MFQVFLPLLPLPPPPLSTQCNTSKCPKCDGKCPDCWSTDTTGKCVCTGDCLKLNSGPEESTPCLTPPTTAGSYDNIATAKAVWAAGCGIVWSNLSVSTSGSGNTKTTTAISINPKITSEPLSKSTCTNPFSKNWPSPPKPGMIPSSTTGSSEDGNKTIKGEMDDGKKCCGCDACTVDSSKRPCPPCSCCDNAMKGGGMWISGKAWGKGTANKNSSPAFPAIPPPAKSNGCGSALGMTTYCGAGYQGCADGNPASLALWSEICKLDDFAEKGVTKQSTGS